MVAARCRDPVTRARREVDARVGAPPKGNMVHKPSVKKLWIGCQMTEDREEWMEEVWGHW